ncbi:unnamed protein product, partial [marine sediment metagenome]
RQILIANYLTLFQICMNHFKIPIPIPAVGKTPE